MEHPTNTASEASEQAWCEVSACLAQKKHVLVEAGAGAGKTHMLVKTLRFLIERNGAQLLRLHQKIGCITFTNAAKDEIESRIDLNPIVDVATIHAFCWSLIKRFQRPLREQLRHVRGWHKDINEINEQSIEYDLGYKRITVDVISIRHDDVLDLTVRFMDIDKFRNLLSSKYPFILIDEYQDTNNMWIESIKEHFLKNDSTPQFGFFGDHWQKIYDWGCGKIEHANLNEVGVKANFRSVAAIVNCLNSMRPNLPQAENDPIAQGEVRIFHTNDWNVPRRSGQHWDGDLEATDATRAFHSVQKLLTHDGWDLSVNSTKILMLTHRVLAREQGYPDLLNTFKDNQAYTKKEHPHIAFFVDILEPVCNAYRSRRYGEMFHQLGTLETPIRSITDKLKWSTAMDKLMVLREHETVGDVMDHLKTVECLQIPTKVKELEDLRHKDYQQHHSLESEQERDEIDKLRSIPYKQIISLYQYLEEHSPFATQHGAKGREFENVIVVIGRGWAKYDFNRMLETEANGHAHFHSSQFAFELNRNLFYVSCSRAKKRLAVLFTQQLSTAALQTVTRWFGGEALEPVPF